MKKKNIAILIILSAICIGVFIFYKTAGSVVPVFGGKVIGSPYFCDCSGNFLVTISPPVPGVFVYQPFSQGFLWYNLPNPGIWALGIYTPGAGQCLVYSGKSCTAIPNMGLITPMVGTSPTI